MVRTQPEDLPATGHLDSLLDALATGEPTDSLAAGLDPELVATAHRLKTATLVAAPDPHFAQELRRSLLTAHPAQPAAAARSRSHRVLGLTLSPPALPWHRRGWWPRLELTAMLLAVAVLIIAIAGPGDRYRRFIDAPNSTKLSTNNDPSAGAPASATTSTPISTVTPVDNVTFPVTPTAVTGSTRFAVGDTVYTARANVALRSGPSFTTEQRATLDINTELTIIGESEFGDNRFWWPVGDPGTGVNGYIVSDALNLQRVNLPPSPTVVTTGFVDPTSLTEIAVTVDADGVLNNDAQAIEEATTALRQALAPFTSCQVGFVQTFGYSASIEEGVRIAGAINILLEREFPELFENAVVDNFANVGQDRGRVEIQLYFYRGCAAFSTPPTVTPNPTVTPIAEEVLPTRPPSVTPPPMPTIGIARTVPPPATPKAQRAPTIVFLLDRSGSASYDPLGGTTKLEMEQEAIKRAVADLPNGVSVGVIAFNTELSWIVPITEINDAQDQQLRQDISQAVDAIGAEGGSALIPVLLEVGGFAGREAIPGLTDVVLFADGKFVDENIFAYGALIEAMAEQGIIFSAIAIGDDADTTTMQGLAGAGGGRFHHVQSDADIPNVVVVDGMVSIAE